MLTHVATCFRRIRGWNTNTYVSLGQSIKLDRIPAANAAKARSHKRKLVVKIKKDKTANAVAEGKLDVMIRLIGQNAIEIFFSKID